MPKDTLSNIGIHHIIKIVGRLKMTENHSDQFTKIIMLNFLWRTFIQNSKK
jgi:hypothetical protein